jgi:hypothetical protein
MTPRLNSAENRALDPSTHRADLNFLAGFLLGVATAGTFAALVILFSR